MHLVLVAGNGIWDGMPHKPEDLLDQLLEANSEYNEVALDSWSFSNSWKA